MPSPSNIYAEKVFSEHPIALWPLDDKADYISLISEQNRSLQGWTIDNGTATVVPSILDEPFPNSSVSKVLASSSSGSFYVSSVSPDLINFSNLNQELSTFCIGAFLYSNTPYISGFEIGYEYYDSVSGELVQDLKYFSTEIYQNWIFVSETFTPPSDNVSARLVIKAKFYEGDDLENYFYLVNGISFGQWAEEFNSTSLGSEPQTLPSSIFGNSLVKGIPAKAYGLETLDGYYLINDNSLVAKNSGIPLIFGASNSTIIQKNNNDLPSVILPGMGFLNDAGKYRDYTFEFWARINSDSVEEKRIFGNIRGTDGLYVNGTTLSLKIGKNIIRHYVGQWYRPMLIQIRYSISSISLVINGEQVGELFIDIDEISFPLKADNGLDNDWIGFWSYDNVSPIDLDAIAIYGYKASIQVAKRRFIYGQGVEFPENINNAYSGSSIFIDYPFAKYAKNYSYPNLGKWQQGAYDNLLISGNAISFPNYKLPEARFDNKTKDEWLSALELSQNEFEHFISLKPNSSWNSTNGYLFIENGNLVNEETRAIYVTFKETQEPPEDYSILVIEERSTGSSFQIVVTSSEIRYLIVENGESYLIASKPRYNLPNIGEKSVVGLDIRKFSNYYGGKAAQFFGRLASPAIYVGGNKQLTNTFTGKIYEVGLCSAKNLLEISSIFSFDGLPFSDTFIDGSTPHEDSADGGDWNATTFDLLYDGGTLGQYAESVISSHTPSYGVVAGEGLAGFNLMVSSKSSWQDYVPLSFFAKTVNDSRGDSRLDLDFIQLNINYPAPSIFIQDQEVGSWTYEELSEEFSNPVQRGYESLDNQLFTGFESYEDLKNKAQNSYKYDTSSSVVKTYVTFQLLEEGANKPTSSFVNTELPPKDGIVIPGEDWMTTKYEVVDNMVIYPPSSISFEDIAIVTHIELESDSIIDNPISIKSLEYASMSLSDTAPTAVGTRFGNDIYPYRKDGFYFNYKEKNPFSIYKGSTPYLYLTRNSGITIRGAYDPLVNRGISIPINHTQSDNFKVIAMQMAFRFDQDFFPYAPTKLFEIQSKNSYIKVYMVATHPSGKRAKIYAINSRGELENGLAFYLNGRIVRDPTITVKEWAMLGIRFANTQEFGGYSGAIRLTGPLTFNNISYYKSTNLQEVQTVVERPWFKVQNAGALTLEWNYWNAIPYLWREVLVISTTSYYGVDPSDIYKIYTGTNKIIIDDEEQTTFGDYSYSLAKGISWRSQVYQAV